MNNPGLSKGTFALFASKVFFILAGYGLYIGLGHLLSTEDFGRYGILFGVITVVNTMLIIGSMQTISHFVAGGPGTENAVRNRGFRYQALPALSLAALFFLVSPLLGDFFHDPRLVSLLRASAIIPLIHAFYAVNTGYFNGLRRFGVQAALDTLFQVLRLSFILGLVALGFGLWGVVGGYALAAILVLLVSFGVPGVDQKKETDLSGVLKKSLPGLFQPENRKAWFSVFSEFHGLRNSMKFAAPSMARVQVVFQQPVSIGAFFRFGFPVMGVALLFTVVLHADLFLLKHLSPQATADTAAGLYTAAQSIARIPFHIMVTASMVMFPALARLQSGDQRDQDLRAEGTERALITVLALLAGMAAASIPLSGRILLLIYPAKFAPAAPSLALLIAGVCVLTLVHLSVSMISGNGRPGVSAGILAGTLATQVLLAFLLIPRYGALGAAAATTLAAVCGLGVALRWLKRNFRARLDGGIVRKIALISMITLGLSWGLSALFPRLSSFSTLALCALTFSVHLLLLARWGVVSWPRRRTDATP